MGFSVFLARIIPSFQFVGHFYHHENMCFHCSPSISQPLQITIKCNWFQKLFQLSSAVLWPHKYLTNLQLKKQKEKTNKFAKISSWLNAPGIKPQSASQVLQFLFNRTTFLQNILGHSPLFFIRNALYQPKKVLLPTKFSEFVYVVISVNSGKVSLLLIIQATCKRQRSSSLFPRIALFEIIIFLIYELCVLKEANQLTSRAIIMQPT